MQENIITRKKGEHRRRKDQTKESQEHKQKQDKHSKIAHT